MEKSSTGLIEADARHVTHGGSVLMNIDIPALAPLWRSSSPATAVRELVALSRQAAELPLVLATRQRPHAVDVESAPAAPRYQRWVDTPVVLVHGYLSTDRYWTPLIDRLHANGFGHISCLRYNTRTTTIPEAAAALTAAAATAAQRSGAVGVHLVGHSLGGLTIRYAVQRLGLHRLALAAVTIATPHRGSLVAHAAPGPSGAQLRPGSTLLTGLPALTAHPTVRWSVIYADADVVVAPGSATDGRPADAIAIAGHGHLSILQSAQLADTVVEHLLRTEACTSTTPTTPPTTRREYPTVHLQ